jgi:flagellar biosynthesis GTPase FlhF
LTFNEWRYSSKNINDIYYKIASPFELPECRNLSGSGKIAMDLGLNYYKGVYIGNGPWRVISVKRQNANHDRKYEFTNINMGFNEITFYANEATYEKIRNIIINGTSKAKIEINEIFNRYLNNLNVELDMKRKAEREAELLDRQRNPEKWARIDAEEEAKAQRRQLQEQMEKMQEEHQQAMEKMRADMQAAAKQAQEDLKKAEYEREKNEEEIMKKTIVTAYQWTDNLVLAKNKFGNTVISAHGKLQGYTSSTVTVKRFFMIVTYNTKGNVVHSIQARD